MLLLLQKYCKVNNTRLKLSAGEKKTFNHEYFCNPRVDELEFGRTC